MRNVYSFSTKVPEETTFGRFRIRREYDIKIEHGIGYGRTDWITVAQDKAQ
jgi:hypothetical protein